MFLVVSLVDFHSNIISKFTCFSSQKTFWTFQTIVWILISLLIKSICFHDFRIQGSLRSLRLMSFYYGVIYFLYEQIQIKSLYSWHSLHFSGSQRCLLFRELDESNELLVSVEWFVPYFWKPVGSLEKWFLLCFCFENVL